MFVLWLLLAFIVGGICGVGLTCLLFLAAYYNDICEIGSICSSFLDKYNDIGGNNMFKVENKDVYDKLIDKFVDNLVGRIAFYTTITQEGCKLYRTSL